MRHPISDALWQKSGISAVKGWFTRFITCDAPADEITACLATLMHKIRFAGLYGQDYQS